jgi:hypothetical protein
MEGAEEVEEEQVRRKQPEYRKKEFWDTRYQ